jgi:hypothetical protein
VATDISTIQSAIHSFRDQYLALPGDMPNATKFWGIEDGGGSTTGNDDLCYTFASSSKKTCNGNGDGMINPGYSTTTQAERGRFWQHLANAGLIEGQYTGYHGPFAAEVRIGGKNSKGSKLAGTDWNVAYVSIAAATGNSRFYDSVNANILELSLDFNGTEVQRTLFKPEEQWNIDTKLDDGMPATGTIRGPKQGYAYDANCTDGTTTAANYNFSSSNKECFPTIYLR